MTKFENSDAIVLGLIKHLNLASNTSISKISRIKSLDILQEVLEYLVLNISTEIDEELQSIYSRVLPKILVKVIKAKVCINTSPQDFKDEVGFLRIVLGYNNPNM